jgi:hypothetical protein
MAIPSFFPCSLPIHSLKEANTNLERCIVGDKIDLCAKLKVIDVSGTLAEVSIEETPFPDD